MKSEGMAEDLPYAARVASELGVRLDAVEVDTRLIERLPQAIFHLDEPQADPAALNVMVISELARREGIKVLLSGTAGDDLFSGYRRHVALGCERYWAWLPQGARALVAGAAGRLPRAGSHLRRAAKALEYAGLEGDRRLLSYFYWLAPEASASLFATDYRFNAAEVLTPMLDHLQQLRPAPHGLNRMLALEQAFFLPDHNLNYTDKLAMAHGVEVRVPFLDIDLAAFANSLRMAVKLRGTQTKWLFKKAMEPYLPREVIYRPKTGFGAPLRHWLRHDLAPWVREYLGSNSLRSRGLFDPPAIDALLRNHHAGRIDASYTVFALVCFEIWCRTFIDHAIPAVVS
jgi:asparagine synthase (glutamine-hydrolysing)